MCLCSSWFDYKSKIIQSSPVFFCYWYQASNLLHCQIDCQTYTHHCIQDAENTAVPNARSQVGGVAIGTTNIVRICECPRFQKALFPFIYRKTEAGASFSHHSHVNRRPKRSKTLPCKLRPFCFELRGALTDWRSHVVYWLTLQSSQCSDLSPSLQGHLSQLSQCWRKADSVTKQVWRANPKIAELHILLTLKTPWALMCRYMIPLTVHY